MATPEAAQGQLDRELRALDFIAREYGTEEEVQQYHETIGQPTYGDPMFERIFTARAVRELLQHITKIEVPEEVLMQDEKQNEYVVGEDEPREWAPSHLNPEATSGQGPVDEDVAAAQLAGDREGQQADPTEDLSVEEQNRAESDISTNDEENEDNS